MAQQIPAHGEPATSGLFIVNPLSGRGALKNVFSTHPTIEDRVERLLAMTPSRAPWRRRMAA